MVIARGPHQVNVMRNEWISMISPVLCGICFGIKLEKRLAHPNSMMHWCLIEQPVWSAHMQSTRTRHSPLCIPFEEFFYIAPNNFVSAGPNVALSKPTSRHSANVFSPSTW